MPNGLNGVGGKKRPQSREKRSRKNGNRSRAWPGTSAVLIWFWTLGLLVALSTVVHKADRTYQDQKTGVRDVPLLKASWAASRMDPGSGRKVAIVIDDLGQNLEMGERFLKLGIPLTFSVLPYRPHSQALARKICEKGGEVLLHLPLEPRDYPKINPGVGCLLVTMEKEEIQAELTEQIDSLPCCSGVSTHMGSFFTEFEDPMAWVLAVVKERGLFFVDSLTTPHSVAAMLARSRRLPFVHRSHFLDEQRDVDYIVRQLCRLSDFAMSSGWAVGIGHACEETLQALPKGLSAFAEKGIKLVTVSELIRAMEEGTEGRAPSIVKVGEGDEKGKRAAPTNHPS